MRIPNFKTLIMSYIIFDKLFAKYQQYFTMESIKLPEFLNTSEKYNEMVRKTDTVQKYEEVFYQLLGDESLPLLDILTLMKRIEHDVILLHGINDVTHILELTESFIRYMCSRKKGGPKFLGNTYCTKTEGRVKTT